MNPASGEVRGRLAPETRWCWSASTPLPWTPPPTARAADGIVAYSGVCSHTGCDVSEWIDSTRTLLCPCHDSEFDPARGAEVVLGPAPRRLAALPLAIVDGALEAAGGFIGRVGADPP